jgi:hypothetical protein
MPKIEETRALHAGRGGLRRSKSTSGGASLCCTVCSQTQLRTRRRHVCERTRPVTVTSAPDQRLMQGLCLGSFTGTEAGREERRRRGASDSFTVRPSTFAVMYMCILCLA